MLTDKVLKMFGHYTLFFPSAGVPEGAVCVKYHTILETMQAICKAFFVKLGYEYYEILVKY